MESDTLRHALDLRALARLEAGPDTPLPGSLRSRLWTKASELLGPPRGPERAAGRVPSAAEPTDAELLRRLRANDVEAFDALVERHGGALLGYAQRKLGEGHEAEETVHDAFVKLLVRARAGELEPDSHARGLLFAILRDAVVDVLRRRARSREEVADPAEALAAERHPGPDPLALLEAAETHDRVIDALEDACDPLEQDVLLLAWKGHTGPEIAARLELSPANARKIKSRALHKLKRRLGGNP